MESALTIPAGTGNIEIYTDIFRYTQQAGF
jgi:hypothetical protein